LLEHSASVSGVKEKNEGPAASPSSHELGRARSRGLAGLSPRRRLYLSVTVLVAWMILLFAGVALGGATHLLLLVALVAFPWR
jgi:hypothetical protein